jgi:hypothetical protein
MIGIASMFLVNCSDGEPIAAGLLLSSLQILSTLDLYHPTFEQDLVQSTQSYYHAEAEKLSLTLTPAEYIAHVYQRLRMEELRCDRYFERPSKKEVMEVVQQELISLVCESIIEKGFNDLVKSNDIESLQTLYSLLSMVLETEVMRTAWAEYIKVVSPKSY